MHKLLFFMATGLALAGDKDFDGRWNLTVQNEARGRAWWLEVTDAGSSKIKGRFVGFPGGQMDPIPEIKVDHHELRWVSKDRVYTAVLQKDKLTGNLSINGKVVNTFTGDRAPTIRDRDDERWKQGKTEDLLESLSGWEPTFPNRPVEWAIEGGVLKNAPKASDIKTKDTYWNFELHAEYRFEAGSNSGVGLRGRYEIQIYDTFGKPIDGHSHGGVYSRIPPAVQASNPAGEWQTLDIRLVGRIVTVKLNGKVTVDHKEIEGPTAMCFDPNESMPGPIALQGDHGVVEFRKLTVTTLTR